MLHFLWGCILPPTLFKGAGTFIFIEVWLYYIFNQLSTIVVTQMSFTPVRFNRLWKNKKNKWPHNGLQMTLSDPKWPENIIFFFNNSHFGSCNMYSHCFFFAILCRLHLSDLSLVSSNDLQLTSSDPKWFKNISFFNSSRFGHGTCLLIFFLECWINYAFQIWGLSHQVT